MSTVQPVKIHGYVKTSDVNWHLIVLKVPSTYVLVVSI